MSPYYVIDIVCLAVLLGMIISLSSNRDDLSRLFLIVSWTIVFLCLFEFILSVAMVRAYRMTAQLSTVCFVCSTCYMSYTWFGYVSQRLNDSSQVSLRLKNNVSRIAALVFFAFVLWASFDERFFSIARNGRLILGPYFLLLLSFGIFYSALSALICLKGYLHSGDRKFRHLCVVICLLSLFDIIAAMMQYLTKLPFICLVATVSMIYYFISIQENGISLDSLTRLNNRSRLDLFFRENFVGVSSGSELSYMIFIDINKFKQINDSYGHMEGDRALKLVADSIREADFDLKVFNSRISGDEFVVVLTVQDRAEVDNYIIKLRESIADRCQDRPYTISISVGYTLIPDGCEDIQDVLKPAEVQMYADKKRLTGMA